MLNSNRIGYWLSEKKSQKINVTELKRVFGEKGYELVKIDLEIDIEQQGPFDAIIHKLSDLLCKLECDASARHQYKSFEHYAKKHPEIVIIDSLENVDKVLDRYRQYKIIEESEFSKEDVVFTPAFVVLKSTNVEENLAKMKAANVKFPCVCKPLLAHGTRHAHEMSLIFNEKGLESITPPCVAQTFINHNAQLFKLFIIKDKYFVIERPSIKNFKPNCNYDVVHFDSHDISKPYSTSFLIELDEEDAKTCPVAETDPKILDRIVKVIGAELGLFLFGIDVIIENETGRYAIIDMNLFPGYDGVDNFVGLYSDAVIKEIELARQRLAKSSNGTRKVGLKKDYNCSGETAKLTGKTEANGTMYCSADMDSGIDTSDSCDERKSKSDQTPPIKLYKKQHCRLQQLQQKPAITTTTTPTTDLQSLTEKNEKV